MFSNANDLQILYKQFISKVHNQVIQIYIVAEKSRDQGTAFQAEILRCMPHYKYKFVTKNKQLLYIDILKSHKSIFKFYDVRIGRKNKNFTLYPDELKQTTRKRYQLKCSPLFLT
jgi:phosphorylcholine metabolism protein LicD